MTCRAWERLSNPRAVDTDITPEQLRNFSTTWGSRARASGYKSAGNLRIIHTAVDMIISPVKNIIGGLGAQAREVSNLIHREIFNRTALTDRLAKKYATMNEVYLPDPIDRLHTARLRELEFEKIPKKWLDEVERGVTPLAKAARGWLDEMASLTDEVADYMGLPANKRNNFYIPHIFDPKARAAYLRSEMSEARRAYQNRKKTDGSELYRHPNGQTQSIKDHRALKAIQQKLEEQHKMTKMPGFDISEDIYELKKFNRPVDWMNEKRRFGDMQNLRMQHPDDIMAHYISAAGRTRFLQKVNPLIEGLAKNVRGKDRVAVRSQILDVRDLLTGTGGPMWEDIQLHKLIKSGEFIPQDVILRNPELVGRFTAMMRHLTFMKLLSTNPSSILVNLTQGPANTIAALGAKWYLGGLGDALKSIGGDSEVLGWLAESGRLGKFGKQYKMGQLDSERLTDIFKHVKGVGDLGLVETASMGYSLGEDVNIVSSMFAGVRKSKAVLKEYNRLAARAMNPERLADGRIRRALTEQADIDAYIWKNLKGEYKDGTILYREDEIARAGRDLDLRLTKEGDLTSLPPNATDAQIAERVALMQQTGLDPGALARASRVPADTRLRNVLTKGGRETRRDAIAHTKDLGSRSLDPLREVRLAAEGGLAGEKQFIRKKGLDAVNQLQHAYDKINLPSAAHRSALMRGALQFQDFLRMELEFMFHTLGNPLASKANAFRWFKLLGLVSAVGGPFTLPFFMDIARFSPRFREAISDLENMTLFEVGGTKVKWGIGPTLGKNLASRMAVSMGQEYNFEREGFAKIVDMFPLASTIDDFLKPVGLAAGAALKSGALSEQGLDVQQMEQRLRGNTSIDESGIRAAYPVDSAAGKAMLALKPGVDPALQTAQRAYAVEKAAAFGPSLPAKIGNMLSAAFTPQPKGALQATLGIEQWGDVVLAPGHRLINAPPAPLVRQLATAAKLQTAQEGAEPGRGGRRGAELPEGFLGDVSRGLGYMGVSPRPENRAILRAQERANEGDDAITVAQAQTNRALMTGGKDQPAISAAFAAAMSTSKQGPQSTQEQAENAFIDQGVTEHARRVGAYSNVQKARHFEENVNILTHEWHQAERRGDLEQAQTNRRKLQEYITGAFQPQYERLAMDHPSWDYQRRKKEVEDLDDKMISVAEATGDSDFADALFIQFTSATAWKNHVTGAWHPSELREGFTNAVALAKKEGRDPVEATLIWLGTKDHKARERARLFAMLTFRNMQPPIDASRLYSDVSLTP